MAKAESHDRQALTVVVRAMKMAPWAAAELLFETVVSELSAALKSALVEVAVVVLERIPAADVVVRADLLQESLVLRRGQLVAATMKKYQV